MKKGMKLKALLLGFSICAASGAVGTTALLAKEAPANVTSAYADETTEAGTTAEAVAEIAGKTYATLQEAINAAETGATVKLLANTNANVTVAKAQNLTLDLNGFTLNGGTVKSTPALLNYGTIVITDSSEAKTGTIKRDDDGSRTEGGELGYYVIRNFGNMTIEQANVYNNSYTENNASSLVINGDDEKISVNAVLTINGGIFRQDKGIVVKNGDFGTLVINGGTFNSEESFAVENWSNATLKGGVLNGGLFTGSYDARIGMGNTTFTGKTVLNGVIRMYSYGDTKLTPKLSVEGGTLKVAKLTIDKPDYCDISISGGTLSGDEETITALKEYTADGCELAANSDGTYQAIQYYAQIGETKYTSFSEAIEAAEAGDTVYLLNNISDFAGVRIEEKDLTIDFGNYTITGATNAVCFNVVLSSVTFKASGKGGLNGGSGGNNVAICANTNSTVTIQSGNYTVGGDKNGYGNSTIYVVDTGKVNITDGTFSSEKPYAGRYYVLNLQNSSKGSITVSGGTFINYSPAAGDDNLGGNFVAEHCGVTRNSDENGNTTYTVKSGVCAQTIDKDGNLLAAYATLQEALDAANENETVALLNNTEANVTIAKEKNIIFDLNGYTLNGGTVKSTPALLNYGTVTITDSSKAKSGTIKRDDDGSRTEGGELGYYVIRNFGNMTIEQANVENNSYIPGNGSSMICNGDDEKTSDNAVLTINGGTFTQNKFNVIKNGECGTLIINGGEFNCEESLAVMNWSNATLNGGVLNGDLFTGAYDARIAMGNTTFNGTTVLNGAIITNSYDLTPKLIITGGTLNVKDLEIDDLAYCDIAISAGTITGSEETIAKLKDYAADGYVLVKNTDGSYSPAETVIKQSQATLGSDITMKFFLSSADYTVSVTLNKNGSEEITELKSSGTTENGLYIYSFTGLTPQMLNRSFTVNVYNGDVLRDSYTYSVLEYCNYLLAQEETTAETKTLIAELLNYGKAAQEYLGTDSAELTEAIKNAGLTTGSTIDSEAAITNSGNEIIVSGATLNFSHDNKLVFVIAKDMYANLGKYTITVNDKKIAADEWVASGDYYMWYSEGILATAFDTEYKMLVTDAEGNKLQEITISVNAYCATANKLANASEKLKNLVIATYNYGKAAKAYAAK